MDQYIGKLLDNRYEILELVGIGGMAKVYKARDHRLNRLVAIKILREELAQDAEFRRRFHDESQAVAMLSHPNIVAVYDVSRSSELEYIVMELIDGINLKQYMQKKGTLNWREALHFIIQITKALGHAHSRGIIHRDIKPHNIMVLRDGSVKVADFGIARVASGGHSTLTQETLGSVHYISPEQARGSYIDARSDLYSAGVVLYEMITGRLPFEGDTPVSVAIQHINSIPLSPRELDSSIPEALEAITMKAMAPNPDDRYLSADEMLADLEEFRKNPNINFEYNRGEPVLEENLDEDRTQIRSASRGRDPRDREREREYHRSSSSGRKQDRRSRDRYEDEEEEYDRRGGPVWPIVLSVLAILIFVGGLAYFLYNNILADLLSPPETYIVPNLVGSTYEEVMSNQELLGRFSLVLGLTEENDAPAGTILHQTPTENSTVGVSVTEITVTVSAGVETIPMPDLYNKEYRQAFSELNRLDLKFDYEYVNDDTVAKNYIVSFTPLADMPVMPGDMVHLFISLGPEIKQTIVPSLSERTQEQAIADLHTSNLVEGEITEVFDETVPIGYVVNQYPDAATEVDEGTKVNFQISKGPDPANQKPNVEKLVDIPLPENGEIINLTVMMDGQRIYNEDWDTAMYLVAQVPVTAPEGSTKALSYYWNGVNQGAVTVEFTPDG